ncbi:hypothetical protein GCM10027294_28420 [Marinactinospora endophytica]
MRSRHATPERPAELDRLRQHFGPLGWCLWYGEWTRSFWASHPRLYLLVEGNTFEEFEQALAEAARRLAVPRPHKPAHAARRPSLPVDPLAIAEDLSTISERAPLPI